jgi:hypothetical protein
MPDGRLYHPPLLSSATTALSITQKSIILVRILFRIFVILILGRFFIYILNQLKLNMQILIKVYFKSYNFWIDLLFKKNMFDAFGLKDGPNISIIS